MFHQTLLNWWKKSLYWLHLILWFGCSGSKAKGISRLCAEVNGLITNWASGEKWAVDILVIRMSLFCSIYLHLSPQHEDEILNFATVTMLSAWFCLSYGHSLIAGATQKKNSPLWCFPSVAIDQLWSQKLIDLFPLKILEVEWDWWQSLGSVNMGPWWPDGIWTAPQVRWSECSVL